MGSRGVPLSRRALSEYQPSRQISSFVASALRTYRLLRQLVFTSTGATTVFSHKRHTGKLALAAASILSTAAHAFDVTAPRMVLIAYENVAGGESLLAGKLDTALAEIKRDRTMSSELYTAKLNNQCVAYAAMRQIEQALGA